MLLFTVYLLIGYKPRPANRKVGDFRADIHYCGDVFQDVEPMSAHRPTAPSGCSESVEALSNSL